MRMFCRCVLVGVSVLFAAGFNGQARAAENQISCQLVRSGDAYVGKCAVPYDVYELKIGFDGPSATLGFHPPAGDVPAAVAANLRRKDSEKWNGDMSGRKPDDPKQFSIETRSKVAKTPFGWFGVKKFKVTGKSLALTIDANKLLPPSKDDLKIISQAKSMLSSDKKWNKKGVGQCTSDAHKLDLYCALRKATVAVTGSFQYRQPAMQAAREAAGEVASAGIKAHRLREYNNAKTTTLSDIHLVLDFAYDQIEGLVHS